jgi:hypothetical protein
MPKQGDQKVFAITLTVQDQPRRLGGVGCCDWFGFLIMRRRKRFFLKLIGTRYPAKSASFRGVQVGDDGRIIISDGIYVVYRKMLRIVSVGLGFFPGEETPTAISLKRPLLPVHVTHLHSINEDVISRHTPAHGRNQPFNVASRHLKPLFGSTENSFQETHLCRTVELSHARERDLKKQNRQLLRVGCRDRMNHVAVRLVCAGDEPRAERMGNGETMGGPERRHKTGGVCPQGGPPARSWRWRLVGL